jgi:hypothetical protein
MMTWQEYESRMAQIGPALESDFHTICAERDKVTPSERSNTERSNIERSNIERSNIERSNKVTQ